LERAIRGEEPLPEPNDADNNNSGNVEPNLGEYRGDEETGEGDASENSEGEDEESQPDGPPVPPLAREVPADNVCPANVSGRAGFRVLETQLTPAEVRHRFQLDVMIQRDRLYLAQELVGMDASNGTVKKFNRAVSQKLRGTYQIGMY